MTLLRIRKVSAVTGANATKLRARKITATGTAPVAGKLRVRKISVTGTASPSVRAFAPLVNVEPATQHVLTAVAAAGSPTIDTWEFTTDFGMTLHVVGNVCTFAAPSTMAGVVATVEVVGISSGVRSAPTSAQFTVLPQTDWVRFPGQEWMGMAPMTLI